MKIKLLAATLAMVGSSAFAQEPPTQPAQLPQIPYLQESNNQRIPVDDGYTPPASNVQDDELFNQVDEIRRQQEQYQAALAAREQYAAEQIANSPGAKFLEQARKMYKPSMAFDIEPKQSIVIPVGQGLLNTLSTNFTELKVKTSDARSVIETEGGHLYISIPDSNPVGLVIHEAGVKSSQVSITLIPIDAPPVIADITVSMDDGMKRESVVYQKKMKEEEAINQAKAERVPYSDKHTKRIIDLLTPVAQGDFPRGFTLSGDIPEDYRTPCRMAIPHKAAQRLLGGSEIIDVIGVKNTTDSTYMVREEMCLSDDVIAVALFKKSYLAPGEEMELYILRDKLYYENVQRKARRPRVTWGDE